MNTPKWLESLLNDEIHERINNDPRTSPHTFLGYPRNRIFNDIIGGGQADFDNPVHNLTGDDRALLYAKYNQRGHLDELCHAFSLLFDEPLKCNRFTVIDVGCGPFTAGLSLAAVVGSQQAFRYFGVDSAQSMLRLGKKLADSALHAGAFDMFTSYEFYMELKDLNFGKISGELTVVIASYLLASPTLKIPVFVKDLLVALSKLGPGPVAFLYTNSASNAFIHRYEELKSELVRAGFFVKTEETEKFTETRNARAIHYALFYKDADLTYTQRS